MSEIDTHRQTPDARALICGYLDHLEPRSILTLGHAAAHYCAPHLAQHPNCRHSPLALSADRDDGDLLARLARAPRAEIAVIAGALEHLKRDPANAVIAKLRDLHGARLLALLPQKPRPQDLSRWDLTDLLGLGLRLEARTADSDGEGLLLYGFDIANYKRTPGWLNARHWANPEQWGKARW